MVKGISRRVIVVRSPDPRLFEQAIFLLREDALHSDGISAEQVVNEARQVAAGYIRKSAEHSPRLRRMPSLSRWAYFILGACSTGLVWCLTAMLR